MFFYFSEAIGLPRYCSGQSGSGLHAWAARMSMAPVPHQSGDMDRDLRIGRAGNARARKTLVQLAWLWLRYRPESELSAWFRARVGKLQGRTRRIAIVAMARKLLIALWRFTETGEIPAGSMLRAA
uniref:transposase n=1 Tax=Sphingomonas populi TaxID=2484750 RepID=UPI003CFF5FF3